MAIRELPRYESKYPHYFAVENVDKFVDKVLAKPPHRMAVDTETYYNPDNKSAIIKFIKDSPNNEPFGVSLFWGGIGYWIDHDLDKLKPILENTKIEKVLHNAKYDMFMFKNIGIDLAGYIWDTMLMIQLIDEEIECKTPSGGLKRSKALKNLAYHFLGNDAHDLEDMVSTYRRILATNQGDDKSDVSYKDVSDANRELMKDYACADTEFTFKLFDIFYPMLGEQRLMGAYETDIKATHAVINIERQGLRVDLDLMKHDEVILSDIIDNRTSTIYNIAGMPFNVNSDRELVEQFERLGVKWEWHTETGEYQTDKTVLKGLLGEDTVGRLAEAVLEYRKCAKLKETYITGIYQYIQADGKVHCEYHINPNDYGRGGTKTGRLSASNPNLQNIPKKPLEIDGHVINIRNYFVTDDDFVLIFHDYD